MFRSMYARLLVIALIIMALVVILGGVLSAVTIRNNVVDSRMEALTGQAREIAYLASRVTDSTLSLYLGMTSSTAEYLQWKAQNVYDEFGAYILIVDRNGRVMDNMKVAIRDNPDFARNLQNLDVADTLYQVLLGNEVKTVISDETSGTVFTVAVPCLQNGAVLGAVFIHTSAQVIEAEYKSVLVQVILGTLLVAIVAMLAWLLYTRRITRPLTEITGAAKAMSEGNFAVRCDENGEDEIRQLAGAFNLMADRLDKEEQSRREFVANVSHELRSPVTSIHGFVTGILDGTIPPSEERKYLTIVSDETNRLKRLIADLLQLSRMESGAESLRKSDFDVNECIRLALIRRMNDIEQKHLEPALEFESEPMMVLADKDRIEQVIGNLIDNALKFVADKGHLTIHTALVHDKVSVVVQNDGAPILPEDREHIFERFYKADKAHTAGKGTGLGLSICKRIMDLHGQSIRLIDAPKGVAFEFTLDKGAALAKEKDDTNDVGD